ncbi:class I SAM-dependent methyltransferase [Actinomadura scrupuli]|uniref:class I SAM-dependent methyltransferase n=1 Tax=Actinomadura scrupuli TaxID=559629 RepID=UPI003D971EFC
MSTVPPPTADTFRPASPPPVPLRSWALYRILRRLAARVPVRVVLPDGGHLGGGGPDAPAMRVVRLTDLLGRVALNGSIGFGEAYVAGDWTSDDPVGVLTPMAARLTKPVNRPLAALRRRIDRHRPAGERNTVAGVRHNVQRHYDLSNEFFALFLDETMTYSSAVFGPGDDLVAAQRRKIGAILDLARVGPGSRVLEIGTGWGELAIAAARRGATVDTLTVSPAQHRLAEERIAAAGFARQIRVLSRDYRDVHGRFDAVVSVEMIEAVGAEFWPDYFAVLRRSLAPGGRIALQTITMPHDRMLATKDLQTWIQKYVFPGGQLPSVTAIEAHVAPHMRITRRHELGPDYARTLSAWRRRLLQHDAEVAALGFDAAFRRLWEYYLAYAEAGFRSGYLNAWQFQISAC